MDYEGLMLVINTKPTAPLFSFVKEFMFEMERVKLSVSPPPSLPNPYKNKACHNNLFWKASDYLRCLFDWLKSIGYNNTTSKISLVFNYKL